MQVFWLPYEPCLHCENSFPLLSFGLLLPPELPIFGKSSYILTIQPIQGTKDATLSTLSERKKMDLYWLPAKKIQQVFPAFLLVVFPE